MKKEEIDFTDYLVKKGVFSEEQIQKIISYAQNRKEKLRDAFIKLKVLTEKEYDTHCAAYFNISYIDLQNYFSDPQVLGLIKQDFALNELVFPLFLSPSSIAIATSNPSNLSAFDQIRGNTQLDVDLYYASEEAIIKSIDRNYSQSIVFNDEKEGSESTDESDSTYDIPRILDSLLNQSVRAGASDLHIEPGEKQLILRQRIDGVLHEINSLPIRLQERLVSRIKVLAKLDISETRIPLDGQIKQTIAGEDVSLRISTVPTLYGENVVIRFLFNSKNKFSLESLGFSEANLKLFRRLFKAPYGMVIVTGPTGSGKTTTLYAALDQLNTIKKNIMTIEDPVEYHIDLLRQIQINPKIGLTFPAGLRAILRQDPDVIMVGEIRDPETASVAIQAALTGHLVLSTLHTNSAAGAITRLVHMGIPPYLIASGVIGIIGQRLVRLLCPSCKESYSPPDKVRKLLSKKDAELYRPSGCNRCNHSGYLGRKGIYECLEITEEIQAAILNLAPTGVYERLGKKNGMATMLEEGLEKIQAGQTSLEEVMVTNQLNIDQETTTTQEKVEA